MKGMTLVEACAVVCVVGVLLAVFVPTFVRQVRTSKTSEAPELLRELHVRAASYFTTPRLVGERRRRRCLPEPAGPAPEVPRVDALPHAFTVQGAPGAATWAALAFEPERPIRYAYTFAPTTAGCDLASDGRTPVLSLRAEGDLDGDGRRGRYERRAVIRGDVLEPTGVLIVHAPLE
jgi:hypothetical protein